MKQLQFSSVKATGKIVTVVFNEPIEQPTAGGTLVSPDGVQYNVEANQMTLDSTDTTDKTLTIDLSSDVTGTPVAGNYKVNLPVDVIADSEGNSKAISFNVPLSANTDTDKPELDDYSYTANANSGTVTVSYDKDMSASAINVANYTVDGVKVFETAYFDGNKQNVVLTLKDGAFEFDGNREFKISNVADLSGNTLTTFTLIDLFEDNTSPKLVSAKLNSDQSGITLSFTEAMDALTIADVSDTKNDFAVFVGDQRETATIESVDSTDLTNKTFTITFADALTASEFGKTITIRPTTDFDVADANGNEHKTFTSVTVTK